MLEEECEMLAFLI